MSFELNLSPYKGADWTIGIEIIDAETDLPFPIDGETVDLEIRRRGLVRRRSSTDGTIQFPEPHMIRWRFSKEELAGLGAGRDYRVGCRVTTENL